VTSERHLAEDLEKGAAPKGKLSGRGFAFRLWAKRGLILVLNRNQGGRWGGQNKKAKTYNSRCTRWRVYSCGDAGKGSRECGGVPQEEVFCKSMKESVLPERRKGEEVKTNK